MDPLFLFNFLLPIITFFIGFVLGSYLKFKDLQERAKYAPTNFDELLERAELETKLTSILEDEKEEGIKEPVQDNTPDIITLKRPNAEELERRKDPQKYEGEEEFKKTLESIPELNDNQATIEEIYSNPISAQNDPILSDEELELPEPGD